jgi:hypothetical protein
LQSRKLVTIVIIPGVTERHRCLWHTDKKEKKIFLIYKEIKVIAVAKSYIRKGFLIYKELRKYLVIYEEAVSHV